MTQQVAFDSTLTTGAPERTGQGRLLAVWSFIVVVAILAITALVSDRSLTPNQRIAVFQQSGLYP